MWWYQIKLQKHISRKIGNKKSVVVVSDDREIKDYARGMRARLCSTADFLKLKKKSQVGSKDISYSLQHEITEEMRKIWLKPD